MPEADVSKKEKQYFADIPQQMPVFFLSRYVYTDILWSNTGTGAGTGPLPGAVR